MSYILDALRRADAERERGGVPGLHTQAMPEPGDDETPATRRRLAPWQWLAIGLGGGLAVALAWSWRTDDPPPPPPVPAPMPVQPAPAPPPAAALPAPPPAAPVAIAPMRATPAPTPAAAPAASAAPAPASSPAPATAQRVNSLAELPPEARAGLPPLAFGGSIYSNSPANRLLIVNGQLMHEGDVLAPGVTLEQIRPKAAVLNIRGQRFEVRL